MKIYIDQGEVGDLKALIKKKGEFLTFLHGVNITHPNGRLEITPVYLPLARWEKHSSQTIIAIGYKFPVVMVVLQRRWPLIQVMILKEDEG